jgi:hypothetical protein
LELLPPRVSDPRLLAFLADVLAVHSDASDAAKLRLRLIDRKFSWQALTDLATDQGVVLPMIWGLRRRALLLPVPKASDRASHQHPTAVLEGVYSQHLMRRHRQRDQLLAVIVALNRADIVPLLLKGARYLVAPIGPWCEARDMRDLDILVRQDEAQRAVDALAAESYMPAPEFGPIDQHLPEMMRAGEPSVVEIHTHALTFSARKILATDHVWRQSIPSSTESAAFRVLPQEWHLLHGLLNHQIADRGHARRLLAVKALWEFAALGAGLPEGAWRSIADHMAVRGQTDVIASFIVQAAQLFGLACPQAIAISPAARSHAAGTFAQAARAEWLRRGYFLADGLRHGFARETLTVRYGEVTAGTIARHLRFLLRRYHGQVLRRLIGGGERPV